jgi:hypothetical protein
LGLEKQPERRYPRCGAFVAALRAAYAGSGLAAALPAVPASELPTVVARTTPRRRVPHWALAALALAAAAVVVAGLLSRGSTSLSPPAHGDRARVTHRAGPAALAARGERLVRAGRLSAAVPVLELAVKRLGGSTGPAAASANLVLGQTLVATHRCPAAVTYLSRAVTLRPVSSPAATSLAAARACAAPPKPHPFGHPKPPGHDHGHHHGPGQGDQGDQND